ncbi:bifunctional (p)ppGpp synthetase/guanosine-3',5'-bis(diphosphate) 3'-pyrophosphohydrolase [Candidatus Woesearchaeota archaeon]|nr:bifunctional (p)ppGpp synthetase/guanosine-3',5'-bis(diphosphate) 3'-pyrophosphohydrolase [Candidatus Woesearchaeota archaeon]
MGIGSIIDNVKKYDKFSDVEQIRKAYEFAKKAHNDQKRASGDDYITHPVEVAKILVELKANGPTICAALLHDVVEMCGIEVKEIQKEFGDEIAMLVEGLTKKSKIGFESEAEQNAENLRRMLIATAKDVRMILIKLADRLHNMRTLKYLTEEIRTRISKETLDIYAPIAHKLGIYSIKGELEDLSLRYLNPEMHDYLKTKINEKRTGREKKAEQILNAIKDKLKQEDVDFVDVSGRAKYFYSIYRKMQNDKKDFEEIYDLMAVRVIVRNVSDCYKVIAIIHQMWKPIQGRFKDYIAVPKSNGYQSLHTDVATPFGTTVEIQARTVEMDNTARYGVAAHWRYKGTERDKQFDKRIAWLEQILEWKRTTPREFLESLKIELFQDEIVVFTPKGDPIILPAGATPIDFAYAVHSDVGDHCIRAEINKKTVSLDTSLNGGDIINIITGKKISAARAWLTFIKTDKAKQKIRNALGIEGDEKAPKKEEGEKIDITKFLSCSEKGQLKASKCCNPKFQDEIVAFKTKDGAITIHKKDCANVAVLDASKLVKVEWNVSSSLVKELHVYVNDEYGLVKKILDKLFDSGITVLSVNMKPHKSSVAIALKVKSDNEETIKNTEKELSLMPSVMSVRME